MVMAKVNPASVRRRVAQRSRVSVPETAEDHLRALMRTLDLAPYAARIGDARPSAVRFDSLLKEGPVARELIDDWKQALHFSRKPDWQLTLAEALLFEWYLSWDPLAVEPALPPQFDYLKTVHISRQRAAIALHDYARNIGWRRPVVHVAALRIARAYCRVVVANEHLTAENQRREFTGRLGVATVLMARWVQVLPADLREATAALKESIVQGNDAGVALDYWLEGKLRLFDRDGEVESLRLAASDVRSRRLERGRPSIRIQLANVALRLRDPMVAGHESMESLSRSLGQYARKPIPMEEALGASLLSALITGTCRGQYQIPSTSFPILPFDLRRELPQDFRHLLPLMLEELTVPRFEEEPLARSLAADVLQHMNGIQDESEKSLRDRIALRYSRIYRYDDDRNWLLRCRDILLLATSSQNRRLRLPVISELIERAEEVSSIAASALILVAKDVETNGACAVAMKAKGSRIREMVRDGDVPGLLLEAAAEAERSPDLLPQALGGRSNVTTVGDLYDLTGEMFVFKEVDLDVLNHETARAATLSSKIEESGLDRELVVCTPRLLRNLRAPGKGIAMRRFEAGSSARDVVRDGGAPVGDLLTRLAWNIGWINGAEGLSSVESGRRDIRKRELGMWLKGLGYGEWGVFCDGWWENFRGVPGALRRDAHLDNWIISDSGRIIAIDLEARTRRPLGYEIAQLTEDGAHLPPDDWDTRLAVLRAYSDALGDALPAVDLRRAFEASVVARAVRHLTMPQDGGRCIKHGLSVLSWIQAHGTERTLRSSAAQIIEAYSHSRGDVSFDSRRVSEAERRRLSRRLAYLLRHAPIEDRDPAGWMNLGVAASHIGESVATVVEIATHRDERRYQVSGGAVRALYGHSVAVVDGSRRQSTDTLLFHGTSLDSVRQILSTTDGGLRRMSRQWVHLASNSDDAYSAALRKEHPVVLAVVSKGLAGLWSSTKSTVLGPYVPHDRVRLAPVSIIWPSVSAIYPRS